MGILTRLGLRRSSIWEPYTMLDYLLSSPLVYFSIKFYYFILFLRACSVYPPKDKPALRVEIRCFDGSMAIPIHWWLGCGRLVYSFRWLELALL
ncbi:hypothetical protein B0J15DRAFT_505249 [Fusarium solani]|uniref:Uncharacterized protein n=1 Tax=Fusarium solani TaxID=169388 RepID=A0A9P9JUA9_FUSSL|nr:uncharacterized protein B0J15DRAFT_505249 [Fusarium solani]KAH7232440.1 hypothetical protein B0J15DRAFT_505249 [Fusarium solani]